MMKLQASSGRTQVVRARMHSNISIQRLRYMTCSGSVNRSSNVRDGFTLLELVVVMIVIVILSGAAVPAISRIADSQQRAAETRILRDLNFVRQRAVARGYRTWVIFNIDSDTYQLYEENESHFGRTNRIPIQSPITGQDMTVDFSRDDYGNSDITSVSLSGGSEIGFDFMGRSLDHTEALMDATGTIVINSTTTIEIIPRTGYIRFAP